MSRSSSESNSKDSESDADEIESNTVNTNEKLINSASGPSDSIDDDGEKSELEEGQVTSDSNNDNSSDSSDSEFNDGFDDDLMGDEDDRTRLESLSEKERETEIFKRIERRDVMKTRWEIERKLKQAKRVERAKDKPDDMDAKKKKMSSPTGAASSVSLAKPGIKLSPAPIITRTPINRIDESMLFGNDIVSDDEDAPEYFDPKERSKERKKNVEMNRTDDKRSNAMAMLKAKREGKQKRGKSFKIVRNI